MNKEEKAARVGELVEKMKSSSAMLVADYRGLTVAQSRELRQQLRQAGCASFKVVKNTLTERAADAAGLADVKQFLGGPTAIAFCEEEAVGPAKVLVRYAKEFKPLELKGGVLDGAAIDIEKIKFLASLPPVDVLQAQLLGVMMGPIRGLATVCAGPIRGLVTALARIQEQKEAA